MRLVHNYGVPRDYLSVLAIACFYIYFNKTVHVNVSCIHCIHSLITQVNRSLVHMHEYYSRSVS